jgi:hypothetical protein
MPMEVMLTTDGEACLNSAMVDFSSAINSPRGATERGATFGFVSVAPPSHDCCTSRIATADNATAGQKYFAKREIDIVSGCLFIEFSLSAPRLHFGESVKASGARSLSSRQQLTAAY